MFGYLIHPSNTHFVYICKDFKTLNPPKEKKHTHIYVGTQGDN